MTIASEITRIQTNIANAYTEISNKGGTLPATEDSDNLATAIGTITGGSGQDVIEAYKLPDDAVISTAYADFNNGILNSYAYETNGGGIHFPIDFTANNGDVLELIVPVIFNANPSIDCNIFCFAPQLQSGSGPYFYYSRYGNNISSAMNTSSGTNYTRNTSIGSVNNGKVFFKHTFTFTTSSQFNYKLETSSDGINYNTMYTGSYTDTAATSYKTLVFGHTDEFNSIDARGCNFSIYLSECSLKLNGTKVRDFVEPLPILTTKTITQNGTYNASSDSADGYSKVTVNVGGGNYVLTGYTTVGTPTDNNGIISNFAQDSYIRPYISTQAGASLKGDLELNICFTCPARAGTRTDRNIFTIPNNPSCVFCSDVDGSINYWNESTERTVLAGGVLAAGERAYLKVKVDGYSNKIYSFSCIRGVDYTVDNLPSLDSGLWSTLVVDESKLLSSENRLGGGYTTSSKQFNATIDMNNTNAIIGGQEFWRGRMA